MDSYLSVTPRGRSSKGVTAGPSLSNYELSQFQGWRPLAGLELPTIHGGISRSWDFGVCH
jgi:hypothetical protein